MPWDWVTFPEFLDSVDRTPKGVNVMSLVPLAPLYQYVVGVDKAKEQRATDEELEKMCQLLIEAMEAGGCGWSSQISGDMFKRAARLRRHADGHRHDDRARGHGVCSGHGVPRGAGFAQITGDMDIAETIARESGRPVIWNALGAEERNSASTAGCGGTSRRTRSTS